MAEASNSKKNNYREISQIGVGERARKRMFECLMCSRVVASKHSIEKHLATQHNLSPVKRLKKLYRYDENVPVPTRTLYRWKSSRKILKENADQGQSIDEPLPDTCPDEPDPLLSTDDSFETDASLSDESAFSNSDSDSSVATQLNREDASSNENVLNILSCFQKHKLTASACRDILNTMSSVSASDSYRTLLNYDHLLSHVPTTSYKEIHYCSACGCIFPEDRSVYRCLTEQCPGLRYIGGHSLQDGTKQPGKYFILADIETLLKNLLISPGILEDINRQKDDQDEVLTDICSGQLYKEKQSIMHPENLNLTVTLNTDGVNLYSSSKIELWPVFLVINELSPSLRFARENILLSVLWQGKGKPPFKTILQSLSDEINNLSVNGMQMQLNDDEITVTLSLLCVTVDLPAKAGVLNMTYYNGANACISCDEPGVTVKQGRGHSKSYPYRQKQLQFEMRTHESVIENMALASEQTRVKGFKGVSGLSLFNAFDMVSGTVPDYMHGVLLGITKTLMCKWFSASEAGQGYFVGKQLKEISDRMKNIKPPYQIERLPRDLEKHFNNFKATELQSFLLYYSLPCLVDILPEKYLEHFAYLSEAIYILLGDKISLTMLEHAENLLTRFYCSFSELYGNGSCGLNVHNVCLHLPYYVRRLGPIWAWSCFPFEDCNAQLLQSVHGTGDVLKQALRSQEISIFLRSREDVCKKNRHKLKVTCTTSNCEIIGKLKPVASSLVDLYRALGLQNDCELRKVHRVIVNGCKFYSREYSRMKKRICHCVLYSGSSAGLVQYYVFVPHQDKVYAVILKLQNNRQSWLSKLAAGKQLLAVTLTDNTDIVPVDELLCTLVFIQTEENKAVIVKIANKHGHAVFK